MQSFVYAPYVISEVIWWLALATLLLLTIIYIAKCVVYFEAVRREFYHPVRVNYFFSPWITALFLAQAVPQYLSFNTTTSTKSTTPLQLSGPSPALWCVVMTPILALELKLYGQWLSGGERRLSKVANPSTHMSIVGNFAGAKVAALVGWREAAILFWAVGLAHYLVLFVTLYQRLPTNVVLPKEMHPVYFLFVAVPSSASVAWRYITGRFGNVCKILFFISLFLYSSLVCMSVCMFACLHNTKQTTLNPNSFFLLHHPCIFPRASRLSIRDSNKGFVFVFCFSQGVRFNFFRGCRYSTGTINIFAAVLSILDSNATFH